jgi:hypothetical protein
MKNALLLVPVCVAVLACNKTESTATTTSGSSSASTTTAAPTATTTSAAGALVEKALSFLGGSGPFEGEITMNMTSGDKPPKAITYDVKGTKIRFNSPESSAGYMIFDTTAKKMTMIDDAKKTAMVMDMGAMGAGLAPGSPPAGPKPTIDKTGKNDTVAGYSCELWKMTDPGGDRSDVCVAQGIMFPVMGRGGGHGWMSQLENGFPLRAVTYDSAGKEKSRMEVTKIDKKSLDDAMFQVPAGYTTQDMAEMMKGLGGGSRMGQFRPPH